MKPHLDFETLTFSMLKRQRIMLAHRGKVSCGIVTGIRIEDGSGKKFLVKLDSQEEEIFVTID